MKQRFGISQDGLKFLACLTMLIDHLGAFFFPYSIWMRVVGRVAFPLYCFLLSEGVHHTRNPLRYGLRLLLILVITELPYDMLFRGELTWAKNSAMVTLFLGFCMGMCMKQLPLWGKFLTVLPFAFISRYTHGNYGMNGVLMIALFLLTRDIPFREPVQLLLMILLSLRMAGFPGNLSIQIWAVVAMIPILLYSGEKKNRNPAVQWGFNLFYPLHLAIFWLIQAL